MRRSLMSMLAALSVLTLILGACGDDDAAEPAQSSTTVPAGEEPPGENSGSAGDADDSGNAGDSNGTTAPPSTAPPSTDTTVPSNRGGSEVSSEAYCAAFAEIAEVEDPFDVGAGIADPVERRRVASEAFALFANQIDRAVSVAPSEIAADTATVAGGVRLLADLLEQFDYDFDGLEREAANNPAIARELAEIEGMYAEAADRVESFVEDECGIDL